MSSARVPAGARVLKSMIFLIFGAILEPDVKLEGHVNFAHRGLGVVIDGSTVLGEPGPDRQVRDDRLQQ